MPTRRERPGGHPIGPQWSAHRRDSGAPTATPGGLGRNRLQAGLPPVVSVMKLRTLRTSAEFRRVRGGARSATDAFVVEGKARAGTRGAAASEAVNPSETGTVGEAARFGFTVTKKLGGAVVRNRIRRRLKAAVRALDAGAAEPGHDYVIVARAAALDQPFAALAADVARAVRKAGGAPRPGKKRETQARMPARASERGVRAVSSTTADREDGPPPGLPTDNS